VIAGVSNKQGHKKDGSQKEPVNKRETGNQAFFPAEAFQKDGGKHLKSTEKYRDGTDDPIYGIRGSQ